jgi:hypothetical protein
VATGFLQKYLRYYLTRADLWLDQADALAALRYVDQLDGTHHASEFDALWADFVRNKPSWDIESTVLRFQTSMRALAILHARCSKALDAAG